MDFKTKNITVDNEINDKSVNSPREWIFYGDTTVSWGFSSSQAFSIRVHKVINLIYICLYNYQFTTCLPIHIINSLRVAILFIII